jgi:membrane fusion protein
LTDQLFRKEAVEHRRDRLFGDVVLATPLSTKVLSALIGAMTASAVLLLIFGSYARRETLQGWLSPDTGMARIVPPESGVIGDLFVQEGQQVVAGAPLFSINIATDAGTAATTATRILEQLTAEQRDLEQQLSAVAQGSRLRQQETRQRIVRLQEESAQISNQEKLQQDRTSAAEEQLKQISSVAGKGFIPMSDLQKKQDELWTFRQQIEELKRRRIETEGEQMHLRQEVEAAPIRLSEDSSVIQQRIADLETRRALADRSKQITLRAPVAGTVATIRARPGKYVSASREEMVILPSGGKLQAILYAPTKAAGFLQDGQEVFLRFDAFPSQKYGSARGRIINVSHTILPASEAETPLPDASPVYQVTVSIPDDLFHSWGKALPLQAGMTLKADAVLERQALWKLLFEPLIIASR